jgi:hypothetical protein
LHRPQSSRIAMAAWFGKEGAVDGRQIFQLAKQCVRKLVIERTAREDFTYPLGKFFLILREKDFVESGS